MEILIVAPPSVARARDARGPFERPVSPVARRGGELRASSPFLAGLDLVSDLETDHGVEIALRATSLGRWSSCRRRPLERHSFVRAVAPELERFVDSGEIVHAHSSWLPGGALTGVGGEGGAVHARSRAAGDASGRSVAQRSDVARCCAVADAVVYVSEMLHRAGETSPAGIDPRHPYGVAETSTSSHAPMTCSRS